MGTPKLKQSAHDGRIADCCPVRSFLLRRLIQSALLLWALMTLTYALVRLTPAGLRVMLLEQPESGAGGYRPAAGALWSERPAATGLRQVVGERGPTRFWPLLPLLAATSGLDRRATLADDSAWVAGLLARIARGTPRSGRGVTPGKANRSLHPAADRARRGGTNLVVGLVVIVLLSSTIGWFPNGQGQGRTTHRLAHLIVPATVLALGSLVSFTRFTRAQVLEVLGQDFVRTARGKGLVERTVLTSHVLRNALLPVVTLLGALLPALVSGAALTEGIFNWPGIGRLYLEAAFTRDYPLLLAILPWSPPPRCWAPSWPTSATG